MRHFPFSVRAPDATQPAPAKSRQWRWLAVACALHALPSAAAFSEGEALYRESIMPSPNAVFVVSLEESVRPDVPDPCANAGTQAARDECSYEGFLKASAAMSAQLRQLEAALKPGRRTTWRRVQKAWLTYRTQACHFESSQLANAGERATAQWTCAARMTRERTAELSRLSACGNGAVACPIAIRPGGRLSSIFSRRR